MDDVKGCVVPLAVLYELLLDGADVLLRAAPCLGLYTDLFVVY